MTQFVPLRTVPEKCSTFSFFVCHWWPWPLTPKLKLGRDWCTVHLSTKFYHPTCNRSEVIVLTNKQTNNQTPLKTSTSLHYATPVANESYQTIAFTNSTYYCNCLWCFFLLYFDMIRWVTTNRMAYSSYRTQCLLLVVPSCFWQFRPNLE